MTRYTNMGRKRTHVEAGFDTEVAPFGEASKGAPAASTSALANEAAQAIDTPSEAPPAKKKRKGSKRKAKDQASGPAAEGSDGSKGQELEGGEGERKEVKAKAKKMKAKKPRKDVPRMTPSEVRRQKRIQEKLADTTCFACREKGHAARDCPNGSENAKGKGGMGICYRCGSNKHSLSRCRKPEDHANPFPFASCFVCSGKGHLASSCPQNKDKGVYPNGGSCKLCGETSHLARNCALRKQDYVPTTTFVGTGRDAGADEDDFHTFKRVTREVDREERDETRAWKRADVKVGALTGVVKSFAEAPPAVAKKKVVVF